MDQTRRRMVASLAALGLALPSCAPALGQGGAGADKAKPGQSKNKAAKVQTVTLRVAGMT